MRQKRWLGSRRGFSDLNEQEILALAISSEEDDARIYGAYADGLRDEFPHSAAIFEAMVKEESAHRDALIELHKKRFGDVIPLIRREHVHGYIPRKPDWLIRPLKIEKIRKTAQDMEAQAERFYLAAIRCTKDADTRKLLGRLAEEERNHKNMARVLENKFLDDDAKNEEEAHERRQFILTYVQPGLAGLMDGSVSTLAPIFAAAFATGNTWSTFLIGLSASLGAGISMGFTEVASDDGVISGRGSPIKRGISAGVMTTIGGLGHTLPYLISDFWIATWIAVGVVFVELWVITWIQNKYMETPWMRAAFQVMLGGALVFAVGILIGNA